MNNFEIKLNDLTIVEKYCGPTMKNIIEDEFWKQAVEKKTILQVSLYQWHVYNIFLGGA